VSLPDWRETFITGLRLATDCRAVNAEEQVQGFLAIDPLQDFIRQREGMHRQRGPKLGAYSSMQDKTKRKIEWLA
jgi:hypothetical protein